MKRNAYQLLQEIRENCQRVKCSTAGDGNAMLKAIAEDIARFDAEEADAVGTPYKWVVEFEVSPTWVEDGFNLTEDRAGEMIQEALPWSSSHETTARVIKAPAPERILHEQGYPGKYRPDETGETRAESDLYKE